MSAQVAAAEDLAGEARAAAAREKAARLAAEHRAEEADQMAEECVTTDGSGNEITFSPTSSGTPTPSSVDPSGGGALACVSATECVLVDESGNECGFNWGSPTASSATYQ